MKWQITPNHILGLLERGITPDQVILLSFLEEGTDITELMKNVKIQTVHQSLIRKGLLFGDNKLTTLGKEVVVFISSKDRKKIKKVTSASSEFDLWWDAYPSVDTFEYKGKKFEGSRSFRVKKDECRTKYNTILLQGEYTAQQLIDALKLEVFQKKERSIKENTNKMAYMQNSLSYLNQRTFEGFIELLNAGIRIEETKQIGNATDI